MRTLCIALIIGTFLVTSLGPIPARAEDFVSTLLQSKEQGILVHLSQAFNPPVLKGIKVHPDNPFKFDFILDRGDSSTLDKEGVRGRLQQESTKLIKYFLVSLTVPEKDLWVNLSPYEKNRIVPDAFGQTEMGRDLLAQDYMLKQITASLLYPEDEIGKKFWKRVYEEAAKKFRTTNISVSTFNKVWIVPEKAVVYENAKAGTAYVVESKLKVMLEEDYLALNRNSVGAGLAPAQYNNDVRATARVAPTNINQLGSQIIREIIIPALTKEINSGKNFAQLRQVYNSLILATWYKKRISAGGGSAFGGKDNALSQAYNDKNKIAGVNIQDPLEKEKIYQQYLKAFKKGAYNYIKEEQDPITQQMIPRKYFSGGVDAASIATQVTTITDQMVVPNDSAMIVSASINPKEIDLKNKFEPGREADDQGMLVQQPIFLDPEEIRKVSFESLAEKDQEFVIARLLKTLLVSNQDIEIAAVDVLKKLASVPEGLARIRKVAQQMSDDQKTGWYIFAFENKVVRRDRVGVNPEDFVDMEVHGKKIPLYVVHVSDKKPDFVNNRMMMLDQKSNNRSTFHFAVNGPIGYGAWEEKPYAYVIPLVDLIKENPGKFIGGREGDLMFYGPLLLPEKTALLEATDKENITKISRDYLRPIVGDEGVFEFHNWHSWKLDQEAIEKFRDLILEHGLYYGHHGAHWTMKWEILSQTFNDMFEGLERRRSKIEAWLGEGGNPAFIEDFTYQLPWYSNLGRSLSGWSELADKNMRPYMKIYVEHVGIKREEFLRLCLEFIRQNVPDLEMFRYENVSVNKKIQGRAPWIEELFFPGEGLGYSLLYMLRAPLWGINKSDWERFLIKFYNNREYEFSKTIISALGILLDDRALNPHNESLSAFIRDKKIKQESALILLDSAKAKAFIRQSIEQFDLLDLLDFNIVGDLGGRKIQFGIDDSLVNDAYEMLRFMFFDNEGKARDRVVTLNMFSDVAHYDKQEDGKVYYHELRVATFIRFDNSIPGGVVRFNGDSDTWPEQALRKYLQEEGLGPEIFPSDGMIWTANGNRNIHDVLRDKSMITRGINKAPGGIDLTSGKVPLQVKMDLPVGRQVSTKDNNGIQFHMDPAQLQELQNAPGFEPVILDMQEGVNVRQFLGMDFTPARYAPQHLQAVGGNR